MGLGALYLRLHQTFGHGFAAAYYRDMVRPRILQTPPIRQTTDKSCEIHVLKLDVEGFEADVLEGCLNLLRRKPKLILKLHPPVHATAWMQDVFRLIGESHPASK